MEFILHIGIAQFLFAALLLLTKSRKALSDYVLGCWLLLMTIFMGLTLLKVEFPQAFWGRLQMFPFFFTIGPFLFLYVRTLTRERPRLEFADSLHLLPFVIFSVAAVTMDSPVDEDILQGNSFRFNRLSYSISALVSIGVYILLTFWELNRHQVNLQNLFSYTSARISLGWVRGVIVLFIATILITLVGALINVGTGEQTVNPGIALFLGFTVFAFAVTFFGIRQPDIFHRVADPRFVDSLEEEPAPVSVSEAVSVAVAAEAVVEPISPKDTASNRYARSGLTPARMAIIISDLEAYLATERPWLRRDLTIQDVCADLDIPQHHLTQTINEGLGKNFYTLVNEYRVEEVKLRLNDPRHAHLTVLAIAHDAGFNSKSTFNTVFKRMVGRTPSQFRKDHA
ncbi:MAG: AraC family transcriptional regulator [Bacteroidota bacterium]